MVRISGPIGESKITLDTVILLYKSLSLLQIVKLDPAPRPSSVNTFNKTRPLSGYQNHLCHLELNIEFFQSL